MKKNISLIFALLVSTVFAQQPSFTYGSQRTQVSYNNPETETFRIGKNNYVLYKKFKMADGMLLHLEGFSDPTDAYLCSQDIAIPHEVNEVAIYEGFIALEDKMLLFRSVYKKEDKRSVLYVHEINEKGMLNSTTGKEIASISAEKAMNSGNFIIQASADGKSLVILSEYPFVKETKEKMAVAVFDKNMNQLWTKEMELQYDSRRGPVNSPSVSNSGIVYIIKKVDGAKNADFYSVYQVSDKGNSVVENVVEMEAPKKVINYGSSIEESSGDLVVAGYYTEDGKVTVGGTGFKGTFNMKISGSTHAVLSKSTTPFEKTESNLIVVSVKQIKGNVFLVGEVRTETNVTTDQKDAQGFPVYNKEFVANDILVTVFDAGGKLINMVTLDKENKSVEDGGFANTVAVQMSGEQLMLVYNAHQYKYDGQEHKVVGPMLASLRIPGIQFFGADGSKGQTFAMIDSNVGGKKGTIYLYPNMSAKVTDKEFFFLSKGDPGTIHPVRMKLT